MRISIQACIEGEGSQPSKVITVAVVERQDSFALAAGLLFMRETHALPKQLQTVVLNEQVATRTPTLGESIGMAAEVAHGTCTDLPPQRKSYWQMLPAPRSLAEHIRCLPTDGLPGRCHAKPGLGDGSASTVKPPRRRGDAGAWTGGSVAAGTAAVIGSRLRYRQA